MLLFFAVCAINAHTHFTVDVRLSYKKQQRCEIFVELGILVIYEGAAHRNIRVCYGALHLQIAILFFPTNITVRCTFLT
jgi:hypothetical protein